MLCLTADRPLVVQFASNNAKDFADAVELVSPYVSNLINYLKICNHLCTGFVME